ncbi:undecaprenyldiphospho-muramoylpentapeptide beta-N-acetylglucosaminyltransferase [Haloplasma contractile]|uniref:UDP-N-acetylglucosamine--N-acetylmuramyl-(pentapeptide) pyrophosphoryl-undecaprenol N-acetylglucosamine transferase n=1 Tax=Haloplasma contractile SSD-17B TaxID=1033810 RepID=U2DVX6_9MOLU|nr:undecaprenyldiphospho-muramoylpentapeptide beta-N-acetylglucosaminyltransferase [Haloplasma contractile]ERJ12492.1 pyrophosphoryl-undecaprenol N-acetylglucosamine transferase 2 protein [Haloplasma contractile SSD-17B]
MKKIILTGGGTSGHVTPNIALIPKLKKEGYQIHYIGTQNGIEQNLIGEQEEITYHAIKGGKLRRYVSFKNIVDACKVMGGFVQACHVIRKVKPNVIFSKGGYVSTPVVWGAKLFRVPIVIHESDYTVGLANKLSIPFANKVCFAFPETFEHLPREKSVYTGIPIRDELFSGNKEKGYKFTGLNNKKPILLVTGGSLGSTFINKIVRNQLDELLNHYQVCHLCGKGKLDESLQTKKGYKQYEYISKELPDIFAISDVVVTRGGATFLYELLALKKPMLIIPLSKNASRGDQILNAKSFSKQGFADYIEEEDLTSDRFLISIKQLNKNKENIINKITEYRRESSTKKVLDIIKSITK